MTQSSHVLRRTLYIQQPGTKLGVRAGCWEISFNDVCLKRIPCGLVSQICILNHVHITSAVMVWCAENGIPLLVLSQFGKRVSISYNVAGQMVTTRQRQYELLDKPVRLELVSTILRNKIRNQVSFLTQEFRNHPEYEQDDSSSIAQIQVLRRHCTPQRTIKQMLGIEGRAAKFYFAVFGHCIRNTDFTFEKRHKRPASDPVNALLSFGYSMLLAQVEAALQIRGIDAAIGLFHSLRSGFSLACDLMEEYRVGIVDSLVLSVLNKRQFQPDDFFMVGSACMLKDEPRKRFIQLFEEKMQSKRLHPLSKTPVSWKEILDIQALEYKRFLYDKIEMYIPYRMV